MSEYYENVHYRKEFSQEVRGSVKAATKACIRYQLELTALDPKRKNSKGYAAAITCLKSGGTNLRAVRDLLEISGRKKMDIEEIDLYEPPFAVRGRTQGKNIDKDMVNLEKRVSEKAEQLKRERESLVAERRKRLITKAQKLSF